MNYYISKNELYHHGVLGMKWGVRRYQPYPDGKKGMYLGQKALKGATREPITSENLLKYKSQYKTLSRVKVTDKTKGNIYTKDGKVVGMVNTEKKPDNSIWIQGLEVFGDNKGKGIGKELLNVAVQELGATKLSVRKTNTVAKKMYEKYGFEVEDSDDYMDYMSIGKDYLKKLEGG